MREVQASEAKTHLPALLRSVEQGESIVITRHGRPIARLTPDGEKQRADNNAAVQAILELRKQIQADWKKRGLPPLTTEEIIAMKHEGHKY